MENKNIIIALLLIVVVLAIVAGVMFTQNINAKEPTKLKITSNNTLTEGDNLTLHLADMNRTPISGENVTVTVKNAKGKVVINKTVKTSSKGNARLDLNLKKGKYVVNATFAGNENFTANSTMQKLTVKEKVKQATTESSSSSSSKGWTTVSPGGDTGSTIEVYHDGEGHKYVTRRGADGSAYEDGIAYDENYPITS